MNELIIIGKAIIMMGFLLMLLIKVFLFAVNITKDLFKKGEDVS